MKTKEMIKYFSVKCFIKNAVKSIILKGFPPRVPEVNFYLRGTLKWGIDNFNWKVGRHSYGCPNIIDAGYGASLEIGSFTSIAGDVTIILANHDIKNVSTYPFIGIKCAGIKNIFTERSSNCKDHSTKGNVIIGSDVWIGAGATILPGVNIGHGSVIGANSVVAKSTLPYSVCVGNPARTVKFRFNEDTIKKLLELAWWDIPDEKISTLIDTLASNDIDKFINIFNNNYSVIDS
jgi:acetyltransferase-like isoleucine patch superfamily enzyme